MLKNKRKYNLGMLAITLLLGFQFFIISANAAVNPKFAYQGKLKDSTGLAVTDGSYNLRFRICQDSSCSTVLATETHCYSTDNGSTCTGSGTDQRVSVGAGVFNLLIGSITDLSSLNYNQTLYLEIQVGGSNSTPSWETLLPRKELASVPSAMNSAKLDNLSAATTGDNEHILKTDALGTITSSADISVSDNLNIGTDVILFRGNTDRLDLASGDSLNIISGSVQFGGTTIINSSREIQNITQATIDNVNINGNIISATDDNGLHFYDNAGNGITIADGGNLVITDAGYIGGSSDADLLQLNNESLIVNGRITSLNDNVNTDTTYRGILNQHHHTSGITDDSDYLIGIANTVTEQTSGALGGLYGIDSWTGLNGGTATFVYGINTSTGISSGTASILAGQQNNTFVNASATVYNAYGIYSQLSVDADPGGMAYGLYLSESGDYIDYGIYQNGTAPSRLGGILELPAVYSHDMNGETMRPLMINSLGELGYDSGKSYMVYPSAGIAVSTGSAWGTSINSGWLDQDVSQDASPTFGHLTSLTNSVNTDVSYYGINNSHKKSTGITDSSDNFIGINNAATMDQIGGIINNLFGTSSFTWLTNGTASQVRGFSTQAGMSSGGTATQIAGHHNLTNVFDGATVSTAYGIYSLIDVPSDFAGAAYGLYLSEDGAVDYGIYQNGTAPNRLGGKLEVNVSGIDSSINAIKGRVYKNSGDPSSAYMNAGLFEAWMADTDSIVASLKGIDSYAVITGGETSTIHGSTSWASVNDGLVSSEAHGQYNSLQLSGGEVGIYAYGQHTSLTQSASNEIGLDAYGLYINADLDGTVGGNAYMLYLNEGSNVDYAIYQSGTAPSVLGGNLSIGSGTGELTAGSVQLGSLVSAYGGKLSRVNADDISIGVPGITDVQSLNIVTSGGASLATFNGGGWVTLGPQTGTRSNVDLQDGYAYIKIGSTAEQTITATSTTFGGNIVIPDTGYIGSASDTDAMQIEADGDVIHTQGLSLTGTKGIGVYTAPSAQYGINISDLTFETNNDYNGINVLLRKTGGISDYNDDIYGINSGIMIEQSGGEVGNVYGGFFSPILMDGSIGNASNKKNMYGSYSRAMINMDSDVYGNVYGGYDYVQTNGGISGTVSDDVSATYSRLELGGSTILTGDAYGHFIDVNNYLTTSGTVYLSYLSEGSGVDYAIYHNGTAPSVLGGKLAIGTNSFIGTEKLRVNGGVYVDTSIIVNGTTLNVPDYVFEPEYQLRPVAELEEFISSNRHLPGVVSRDEIKQKGLNYNTMMLSILEKTEENTLYIIDNYKKISVLEINDENQVTDIGDLKLKTDSSISTISELKSSIDANFITINEAMSGISSRLNSSEEMIADYGERIFELEKLKEQMELLKGAQTIIDFASALGDPKLLVYKDVEGNVNLLEGNFEAAKIATAGLKVKNLNEKNKTIGTNYIEVENDDNDGKSYLVKTKAITETCIIFTNFQINPDAYSWVEKIKNDETGEYDGFKINLSEKTSRRVYFDWWILEKEGSSEIPAPNEPIEPSVPEEPVESTVPEEPVVTSEPVPDLSAAAENVSTEEIVPTSEPMAEEN